MSIKQAKVTPIVKSKNSLKQTTAANYCKPKLKIAIQ